MNEYVALVAYTDGIILTAQN